MNVNTRYLSVGSRIASVQPRYSGKWWIDQDGTEWSAFDLWKGSVMHSLDRVLWDDEHGVRTYQTDDDELLHLVRIPPPDASDTKKISFFATWSEQGRPPGT